MILQFKGINNVWCYEEAEQIRWANVYVGSETQKYRQDGERWKVLQEELEKSDDELVQNELKLQFVTEMQQAVNQLIQRETGCGDEVIYYIQSPFDEMENISVVTLADRHKNATYVFENGVYLLNNRGQTVQRIV